MIRPDSYTKSPAISQSDMKLFEEDLNAFYHQKILGETVEKKADHFDLGSLIDALLLDPAQLNNYYVITNFKATGIIKDVVDKTFELAMAAHGEGLDFQRLPKSTNHIEKAIEIVGYKGSAKWDTTQRITKIIEEGVAYFDQLIEGMGKHTVSLEIWNKAHSIVDSLKDDEQTGNLFAMLQGNLSEGWTCHKQTILKGRIGDEEIQGMLDFYFQDEDNAVLFPWDLKSTRSLLTFRGDYKARAYGRQGAFYTELLRQNFPDYDPQPFQFLAVPTEANEIAERFEMSSGDMDIWEHGGILEGGQHIRGFRQIIEDITWHKRIGKWDHRRSYYEKGYNSFNISASAKHVRTAV